MPSGYHIERLPTEHDSRKLSSNATPRPAEPECAISPGELEALQRRIAGEYAEQPGLSVTAAQAQRLWHLDAPTCRRVLVMLVSTRTLKLTPDGRFVQNEIDRPAMPRRRARA